MNFIACPKLIPKLVHSNDASQRYSFNIDQTSFHVLFDIEQKGYIVSENITVLLDVFIYMALKSKIYEPLVIQQVTCGDSTFYTILALKRDDKVLVNLKGRSVLVWNDFQESVNTFYKTLFFDRLIKEGYIFYEKV